MEADAVRHIIGDVGECVLITCAVCKKPVEITQCVSIHNVNYPDTPPAIVCVPCARKRK